MKRLVICCDGTWNSEAEGKGTNVWKLQHLLLDRGLDGVEQRSFYLPGVGTDPSRSWFRRAINRMGGGSFGWGLDLHIIEAYRWLIREYQQGDSLWLFGFSRGAYTARSLVGLTRNCGLLKPHHESMIDRAIQLYRARDPDAHPDAPQSRSFRDNYSWTIDSIAFVGVWDTVGSLGIPGMLGALARILNRKYRFHDVQLSSRVKNAYHAVAVDERRPAFRPTLWEGDDLEKRPGLEQVWFAGVHSDVGGGYAATGLSDITLYWMIKEAAACGLSFDENRVCTSISPDPIGPMEDSRWFIHKMIGLQHVRVIEPRNRQYIQSTVDERIAANTAYRPPNVTPSVPRSINEPCDNPFPTR